jgi:uncharacterized protein DUF1259
MRILPILRRPVAVFCLAFPLFIPAALGQDWTPIQTAFGANGTVLSGPVLHFDLVRSDLSISVNNQLLNPAEVANGYVNFKQLQNGRYFADGSLPAEEAQVPALSSALRANPAVHISAIVNHTALETPKLLWVHFEARGDGAQLANSIAAALGAINNPQRNVTATALRASEVPAAFQPLFTAGNATITQLNGAVYEVVIPRPDEYRYQLGNIPATASLGVGVTFYAQPITGNTIALNTEFALNRAELQGVTDGLKNAGFTVPAMHDHFADDEIRLFFVHGFAVGDQNALGNSLLTVLPPIYDAAH